MAGPPAGRARPTRSNTAGRTARRSTSPRPAGSAASAAQPRRSRGPEAYDRVAERRRITRPKAAIQLSAVFRGGIQGAAPVARAALEEHLDAAHSGQPLLEVIEER